MTNRNPIVLLLLMFLNCGMWYIASSDRLLVNMTLVRNATASGALCLDGSLPAYHLHRGFGEGARNWLLQFEGGGWCNDLESCLDRAKTRRGSTRYMTKLEVFSDFYNWNRVKLRYCDGASFGGDNNFDNGTLVLYFRGQRIWDAIIHDLLPKGLGKAHKALLSGCSAGGLSAFIHCENFAKVLPRNASVKCLSDAGFFLDAEDVTLNHTMRLFYRKLVTLQGMEKNLNQNCTTSLNDPKLCVFPQYALNFITTPFFILNAAYDVYQFNHILVPPSADMPGIWKNCKLNAADCSESQIGILQSFRLNMLLALRHFFTYNNRGGMFINSCFAHCQSESQDTWLADDSPRIHNKTIAEAVGDWYFGRNRSKEIDCPFPCDSSCHNLIPTTRDDRRLTSNVWLESDLDDCKDCLKVQEHNSSSITKTMLAIWIALWLHFLL